MMSIWNKLQRCNPQFAPKCSETWPDICVIFCLKFHLQVSYVEIMMQGLMYLQVSIVSADALEPTGLRHLSANTDLTNVSICSFELWH